MGRRGLFELPGEKQVFQQLANMTKSEE